jgi:hypothetical protein
MAVAVAAPAAAVEVQRSLRRTRTRFPRQEAVRLPYDA